MHLPFLEWARLDLTKSSERLPISPEAYMTSPEIIRYRGYPVEIHQIVTEDGYILEVHRIPYGLSAASRTNRTKRSVFLQHGLFDSDADWIINPSDKALAFILADRGYDVWLGNARGNYYSKKHVTLDVDDEQFWDFSWDEIGAYDIPASLNYIMHVTGRQKLIYIGHSMGTAVFWVAMITRPELNRHIELMVALAPAASVANVKSLARLTAVFLNQIEGVLRVARTRAVLPNTDLHKKARSLMCSRSLKSANMCRNLIFLIAGSDPANFNLTILPVINGHNPSGTSLRTVMQFAKNYRFGEAFIPYDYGAAGNYQRYGQPTPPPYNLSLVTAPVYLFWGQNDLLTTPEDVAWLASKLPNLRASIRVNYDSFNHWDFLWSTNINPLLNDRILPLLPPPFC
nr:lipase 3 [Diaphanosoma celebensis]